MGRNSTHRVAALSGWKAGSQGESKASVSVVWLQGNAIIQKTRDGSGMYLRGEAWKKRQGFVLDLLGWDASRSHVAVHVGNGDRLIKGKLQKRENKPLG